MSLWNIPFSYQRDVFMRTCSPPPSKQPCGVKDEDDFLQILSSVMEKLMSAFSSQMEAVPHSHCQRLSAQRAKFSLESDINLF